MGGSPISFIVLISCARSSSYPVALRDVGATHILEHHVWMIVPLYQHRVLLKTYGWCDQLTLLHDTHFVRRGRPSEHNQFADRADYLLHGEM